MSEYVMTDRMLESIAHNLCSLHDFDPAFVMQNEKFARAVLTEYFRAAPAPQGIGREEIARACCTVDEQNGGGPWDWHDQNGSLAVYYEYADAILAFLPTEPPAQGAG